MPESPAKFVWYDLMTSDTNAAASFYQDVLGWEAQASRVAGHDYSTFSHSGTVVSGLMAIPDPGMRPAWMGYIGVDDVDAYTARVAAEGGAVHVAPRDIPQVGRFSLVADPQGAVFYLFHPLPPSSDPAESEPTPIPGRICWFELAASDPDAAFAFYADLFGWTKAEAHDMGPMGIYQTFSTGGPPVGGMMKTPPGMPTPFWLYYFSVDAAGAAAERVTQAGGRVVHGPTQVPGGGWIAQCLDPQGALFGMSSMQG